LLLVLIQRGAVELRPAIVQQRNYANGPLYRRHPRRLRDPEQSDHLDLYGK